MYSEGEHLQSDVTRYRNHRIERVIVKNPIACHIIFSIQQDIKFACILLQRKWSHLSSTPNPFPREKTRLRRHLACLFFTLSKSAEVGGIMWLGYINNVKKKTNKNEGAGKISNFLLKKTVNFQLKKFFIHFKVDTIISTNFPRFQVFG